MTSRRLFKFSAPGNELMPEPSPEQKPNPEVVTSGESDFESATGESPTPEPTRKLIDVIGGPPQVDTEQTRTKFAEYLEGGPQDKIKEHNLLVESSYFTEPRPNPPYSPPKNLFSAIQRHNQPIVQTLTMAQPVNRSKELSLNKPEPFDGNRENFKKFLQNVEVYMDVNHETYNNDLRKIAFILSQLDQRRHGRHNSSRRLMLDPPPPTLTTDWGLMCNSGRISWRRSPCLTQWETHWTSCKV
jgi:hypothetical protein